MSKCVGVRVLSMTTWVKLFDHNLVGLSIINRFSICLTSESIGIWMKLENIVVESEVLKIIVVVWLNDIDGLKLK